MMSEAVEQIENRSLPLAETHRRLSATLIEREGWLLPAHYGDAAAEYAAVRGGSSAGLFDLSARGRIEVSGAEAVQFLNGLITNDVKSLQPGAWMAAALPNVQGRLLAHTRVLRPGEELKFILDTEPVTSARVHSTLERFTLAGDFRVRDVTGETALLSVQGAGAAGIIRAALGSEFAQVERGRIAFMQTPEGQQSIVMRATHTAEDGYDIICQATDAAALWDALMAANAQPCGDNVLEVLRIEAGIPRYGVDVGEQNVVLEAGSEGEAVSYTKGCYVGQEIIARIHWRGHVAKRVAGLSIEGNNPPAPETEVRAEDGKKIGRVTSAAYSPALGHAISLAMLKYDYLQPGTAVVLASSSGEVVGEARVVELPLVRGSWFAGADEAVAGEKS